MAIAERRRPTKSDYMDEVAHLERRVREQNETIGALRAKLERYETPPRAPSILHPVHELNHLRAERERVEGIARARAIEIRDMRRERDALPTIASVFEVGSPAFHAVWTALQQFVDNRDDSEEGEARVGESEVTVVERAIEEMNAAFAKHTEKLSDNA